MLGVRFIIEAESCDSRESQDSAPFINHNKERVVKLNFFSLISFDKLWSGNHQVPTSLLIEISGERNSERKLALFRFFLMLSIVAELFGYFFITFGLSLQTTSLLFFLGIFLKIGGTLVGSFFQNKAGIFLSLKLQSYLKQLKSCSLEVHSLLADRGCSEAEINALRTLPSDVYQSEINSYQSARILNIGIPISCGLALFMSGDVFTAMLVIILGLISFPIGEGFLIDSTLRKESKLRLGLAAQLLQYVDKVYREHVWLTTKVNFLSQLPLLLFAIRLIFNGSGQLLASFFGLVQGLAGLTGTLAFQKSRVGAMRATETTTHLIQALNSPYLIITPKRWKEHCLNDKSSKIEPSIEKEDGVLLKNFSPIVPSQEHGFFSVSCFIPTGTLCLLKASSGKGKSRFLAALTHLIEHTGDIYFSSNGLLINAHKLSRKEFDAKIFFLREDDIEASARIMDLFKVITFEKNRHFIEESKISFDTLLVDLALKSPDNLIEQEIKNIEDKKLSAFPTSMLYFLKNLRNRQVIQIQELLDKARGNLASDRIFPERTFLTLSAGEKRRLMALIALETCRTIKETTLVILDEPLTHLDQKNIDEQMQCILDMQKLPHPPSILLISHLFIDEIREKLSGVQIYSPE